MLDDLLKEVEQGFIGVALFLAIVVLIWGSGLLVLEYIF